MSNQLKIICNDNYLPDVIKPFLSKNLRDSYCRYILIVPVYFAIFIEFIIFSIVFKKLQKETASRKTFFAFNAFTHLLGKLYLCNILKRHFFIQDNNKRDVTLLFIGLLILSFTSAYLLYEKEKLRLILIYFIYSITLTIILFLFFIFDVSLDLGSYLMNDIVDNIGSTIDYYIGLIPSQKLEDVSSSTTANSHPSTQPKPAPTDPHSPQVPSPDRRSTWVASI